MMKEKKDESEVDFEKIKEEKEPSNSLSSKEKTSYEKIETQKQRFEFLKNILKDIRLDLLIIAIGLIAILTFKSDLKQNIENSFLTILIAIIGHMIGRRFIG